MKKIGILFATIIMVMLFAVSASALEATGSCGNNTTYTYNELTGEVIISGTGKIDDNTFYKNLDIKSVIINDNVTGMYSYAFYGCENLTDVVIGDGIKTISASAFNSCKNLTNLVIGCNVTDIYSSAFSECEKLNNLIIPDSVKSIESGAFGSCTNLSNLVIGDNVEFIGGFAFAYCDKLESVTIPNKVISIGEYAFSSCDNLIEINFGSSVLTIGDYAFSECNKLSDVVIGEKVATIGQWTFYNCINLKNMTVSDSVKFIGDYFCYGCKSLENVSFGKNVESIGRDTFYNCDKLTKIIIPDSVIEIGYFAFGNCDGLKELILGENLKVINREAFKGCVNLDNISIGDKVEEIGDDAFYNTKYYNDINNWENDVLYLEEYLLKANSTIHSNYSIKDGTIAICDNAFENCADLENINIPCTVKFIGSNAFINCSSIKNLIIPDSVISILGEAFWCCTNLTDVTIGDGLVELGGRAFADCENLSKIKVGDNITSFGIYVLKNTAYYNNIDNWEDDVLYLNKYLVAAKSNISGEYTTKKNTILIADGAFYQCNTLTGINISDCITSIGEQAFYQCDKLKYVVIGKDVTSIESYAFYGCSNISNVRFGENVITIGNNAFQACYNLANIKLPLSVTEIGSAAFSGCKIVAIALPNQLKSIGGAAFSGCVNLVNITIPDSVDTLGANAFSRCDKLVDVTIGSGITNIDVSTFSNCYNLESITLGKNIELISAGAFSTCNDLKNVYYAGSEADWDNIIIDNAYVKYDGYNTDLHEADIYFKHQHNYDVITTKEASCTSTGTAKYSCIHGESKVVSIPMIAHEYTSEITIQPTHSEEGLKTYTCECNDSYTEAIPKLEYKVGDVIEFGLYPQNEVKDEVLIAELNALVPDWKIWTSYGYYSGNGEVGSMVQGDWMRYIDITHNGNKYRGVKFTQYRPYYTYYQSSSTYTYQDDRGYNISTIYWFKFEPLKWIVLDPDLGFVMCETVIDSQPYSDTIYSNAGGIYGSFNDPQYKFYACDYETSSIRKWLNNDFYNAAFSSFEKQEITTTTLNNDGYYTSLGSAGYEELDANVTDDSIFLLSYNEVRNNNFGFSNDRNDYDIARQAYASDYAKFQGVVLGDSTKGNSYWLLRTSGPYSFNSCSVFYDGRFASYQSVSHTGYGVRPALRFEDISSVGQNEHQHNYMSIVSKPTCTENGFTTYNCECGDGYVGDYTDPEHTWSEWTTNVYKQEIRYCLLCGEDEVIGGVVVGEIENLTVIADCTSVYLDWDDVPGDAIGYDVFCKMPDSDSYIVIAEGDVSDVEFSFRDGIYGVFCFKVKPFAIIDDEYYWGEFSEEISVEIGHDYITEVTPPTCTEQGYTTYTCECGDSYIDDYTDPEHTWSEWTTNVYKQETRYCLLCGEDEVIGEVVVGEVKNLTATVDCTTVYLEWDDVLGDAIGYDVFCKFSESDSYILYHEGDISECEFYGLSGTIYYKVRAFAIIDGEYYIGGFSEEVSVECGHKYESEITILATHLKEGVETFTCHCGDTYTKPIPKLTEHTHIPTVTNPTCTTQGYSTYICECGDSYIDDYVKENGHSYESEITTPATHLKEGVKTFTCECGDSYTESIAKLEGHSYTSSVTKEPTHLAEGTLIYTCECGDTYEKTIGKLGEHSYTSKITKEPTHIAFGETTFTCECGDSYTESITKLEGHTYTSSVTKEPTHLVEGILTYTCECGDTYTESIEKIKKHIYVAYVIAPTCSEKGYTLNVCECGDSYKSNYVGIVAHSYKYAVIKTATHTSEGLGRYTCSECGDHYDESITKTKDHSYVSTKVASTCTEQGYTLNECECGYSYKTNYLAKIDHTDSNSDGVCDDCGHDLTENCSCNCHKGGIAGFFFKIILFFQKIFKTNQICEGCGIRHY